MTINKRAGRSIKKNIAFYIISIILTMLTSMVIVAAVSTGHTLTKVVDDFVKDYKAEDAVVCHLSAIVRCRYGEARTGI